MYEIVVNGIKHKVEVASDATPLLWVLRDHLGLTGTKFGCGSGFCGACTVHMDGAAIRSCLLPISAVGDHDITTIEGLSEHGDHPLQKAWVAEDVPQCGYCQSGQLMTASAFLASDTEVSDESITQAMSGNVCRCGTYRRIHSAVKHAAEEMQEQA